MSRNCRRSCSGLGARTRRCDAGAGRQRTHRAAARHAPAEGQNEDAASGYAPVYIPGTTSPSSAAMITVAPGEEKGSIDFQYQVVPIARVEGIVTSSTSQLPANVQVSLVNAGFAVPGISPRRRTSRFTGCLPDPERAPGQYTVVARATIPGPGRENRDGAAPIAPGGRGPGPFGRGEMVDGRGRGMAPDATRLWATSEITVDGRNQNVCLDAATGNVGLRARDVRGDDRTAAI